MGSGSDETRGRGRSLARPAFPDDDGAADPDIRALLARDDVSSGQLARALRDARLLTTVVAVLVELDEDGGDKSSHMAAVSMVSERGERGLLAFSGTDSLVAWNPDGRPVPATGREVARAALEDGAQAVVVDVVGPVRRVLSGPDLTALADDLDLPPVAAAIQAALAGLSADGWVRIRVDDARPSEVDVLVTIHPVAGTHPDGRTAEALARHAAAILADRPDIHALVPGGVGVAV